MWCYCQQKYTIYVYSYTYASRNVFLHTEYTGDTPTGSTYSNPSGTTSTQSVSISNTSPSTPGHSMSGSGHCRGSPRSIIPPVMPPYGTEDPKNSENISLSNYLMLMSLVGYIMYEETTAVTNMCIYTYITDLPRVVSYHVILYGSWRDIYVQDSILDTVHGSHFYVASVSKLTSVVSSKL